MGQYLIFNVSSTYSGVLNNKDFLVKNLYQIEKKIYMKEISCLKLFSSMLQILLCSYLNLFSSTTNHPHGLTSALFYLCLLHHTPPHVYLSPLCQQPDEEQIEVETSSALLLVQIIPDIQNARAASGSRSAVSDVSEKPNVGEKRRKGTRCMQNGASDLHFKCRGCFPLDASLKTWLQGASEM